MSILKNDHIQKFFYHLDKSLNFKEWKFTKFAPLYLDNFPIKQTINTWTNLDQIKYLSNV